MDDFITTICDTEYSIGRACRSVGGKSLWAVSTRSLGGDAGIEWQ